MNIKNIAYIKAQPILVVHFLYSRMNSYQGLETSSYGAVIIPLSHHDDCV